LYFVPFWTTSAHVTSFFNNLAFYKKNNQCSPVISPCNEMDASNPSIDRANARTGKWAEDEASKLKDAVKMHGDKDWAAVAVLVPGRTKGQCWNRWHGTLDPSIDRAQQAEGFGTNARWQGLGFNIRAG
jgi:hypothetical protein